MNAQQITADRLAGWAKKLALQNATPFALVGIGHGQHSGAIVLCILENGPSDAEIAQLLRGVANQLCLDMANVREVALRAEVQSLTKDKERLDWLEAHPLKADVKGGSDDGGTGTFWGCGSANCSLRETIDTISAAKTYSP